VRRENKVLRRGAHNEADDGTQRRDQFFSRSIPIIDPRRVALLLLGGDKTGDDRRYDRNGPLADQIYDNYFAEVEEEDKDCQRYRNHYF